ncbi:MAG: hypothetical protein C5S38_03340 [Candidatus Methanophagaceae archaeon]|nr:MAG: hypothetical protein C5S38_03340 [Methanophagales archaeon]
MRAKAIPVFTLMVKRSLWTLYQDCLRVLATPILLVLSTVPVVQLFMSRSVPTAMGLLSRQTRRITAWRTSGNVQSLR